MFLPPLDTRLVDLECPQLSLIRIASSNWIRRNLPFLSCIVGPFVTHIEWVALTDCSVTNLIGPWINFYRNHWALKADAPDLFRFFVFASWKLRGFLLLFIYYRLKALTHGHKRRRRIGMTCSGRVFLFLTEVPLTEFLQLELALYRLCYLLL